MPPLDLLSITPRLAYISDLLRGQRALVLGGHGWEAALACELGAVEALYIDPSPQRVRYAQRRASHPSATAMEGSWGDLPLEDSCVDVVLMTGLPEDTRARRDALSEARRVLTPDGFLLLTLETLRPLPTGDRLLSPSLITATPSIRADLRRHFPQVEFLHQRVDLAVTITPSAQSGALPNHLSQEEGAPVLSIAICSRLMILPTDVSLSLGGLQTLRELILRRRAHAPQEQAASMEHPEASKAQTQALEEAVRESREALREMELDLQIALDDAHQLRTRLQNLGISEEDLTPELSEGKETLKEALLDDLMDESPLRILQRIAPPDAADDTHQSSGEDHQDPDPSLPEQDDSHLYTTAELKVPAWSLAETQAINRSEIAAEITEPLAPVKEPPPEIPPASEETDTAERAEAPAPPLRLSPMAQWEGEAEPPQEDSPSTLEEELDASIARALRGEESQEEVDELEARGAAEAEEDLGDKEEGGQGDERQAEDEGASREEITALKDALKLQEQRLNDIQAALLSQHSEAPAQEPEASTPPTPTQALQEEPSLPPWPNNKAIPLAMPSLFDSLGDGERGGVERPQDGELALLAAITPENLSKLPQVVYSEEE